MTPEVIPSDLANPVTQSPFSLRISPPPPAIPGLPTTDQSVFSFSHPTGGLVHFTWMLVLRFLLGLSLTIAKNSALFLIQRSWMFLFTVPEEKRKEFFWFHNCQIPNGKTIFQGRWWCLNVLFEEQFTFIHSLRSSRKKSWCLLGMPSNFQNFFATIQSLRTWDMDSMARPHSSHAMSRFMPLEPKTSRVGILLW